MKTMTTPPTPAEMEILNEVFFNKVPSNDTLRDRILKCMRLNAERLAVPVEDAEKLAEEYVRELIGYSLVTWSEDKKIWFDRTVDTYKKLYTAGHASRTPEVTALKLRIEELEKEIKL